MNPIHAVFIFLLAFSVMLPIVHRAFKTDNVSLFLLSIPVGMASSYAYVYVVKELL